MRCLDLGAGDLIVSKQLADLGLEVTAIDLMLPKSIPTNVHFVQADITTYQPMGTFDIIIANNVFQFCNRERVLQELLPRLFSALASGGLLIIETFWGNPDPPFHKPIASTFTLADFEMYGKKIYGVQDSETLKRNGQNTTFKYVDYVSRKT